MCLPPAFLSLASVLVGLSIFCVVLVGGLVVVVSFGRNVVGFVVVSELDPPPDDADVV